MENDMIKNEDKQVLRFERGLVSVIMPAWNAEKHIKESIESVLSQTYTNWELLIVDDCSTDGTADLVRSYQEADHRIRLIRRKKNGGPSRAWNSAFRCMHGQYVAFLDADDIWIPEKLEIQLGFMKENDYGFSFASYDWIDENGDSVGKIINVPKMQSYHDMLKNTVIGTLTVVIDRDKVPVDPVPKNVRLNDSALWLSIARKGFNAYGYSGILGHYRILQTSYSRNKFSAAKNLWDLYTDVLKIPFIPKCWYFGWYAINSVIRYYIS